MSAAPVAVIDALNGLLEAELGSIFHVMGEASPYLSRANSEIRRPLHEMVDAGYRRAMELAHAIESLGGEPMPRSIQPQEQYLAFLTLKFLLPKLADSKKLIIQRYENAIRAMKPVASPDLLGLLSRHVGEMESEHAVLIRFSADLITRK